MGSGGPVGGGRGWGRGAVMGWGSVLGRRLWGDVEYPGRRAGLESRCSPEEELQMLKAESEQIRGLFEEINNRIAALEKVRSENNQ